MKAYTTTKDTKKADAIVKIAAAIATAFVVSFSYYVTFVH